VKKCATHRNTNQSENAASASGGTLAAAAVTTLVAMREVTYKLQEIAHPEKYVSPVAEEKTC
jgi:hypothetical protein